MVPRALSSGTSQTSTAGVFFFSFLHPTVLHRDPGSLSHGGGGSEVGEKFEAEAHHEVPDVSGHLGSGNENTPDEHHQDGVEGVTDVPQLVEVFACSRQARQLFIQDVFFGAHAVTFHVLCPVQLAHIKIKHLLILGTHLGHQHG